jgi:hypothetical protein
MQAYAKAIEFHPRRPEMWIAAASYEFCELHNMTAARGLLQRGLRCALCCGCVSVDVRVCVSVCVLVSLCLCLGVCHTHTTSHHHTHTPSHTHAPTHTHHHTITHTITPSQPSQWRARSESWTTPSSCGESICASSCSTGKRCESAPPCALHLNSCARTDLHSLRIHTAAKDISVCIGLGSEEKHTAPCLGRRRACR